MTVKVLESGLLTKSSSVEEAAAEELLSYKVQKNHWFRLVTADPELEAVAHLTTTVHPPCRISAVAVESLVEAVVLVNIHMAARAVLLVVAVDQATTQTNPQTAE
tara:strand:+ start:628 stop:942 length:315 start_codon:yes stop_codon:yes gene_type:complete